MAVAWAREWAWAEAGAASVTTQGIGRRMAVRGVHCARLLYHFTRREAGSIVKAGKSVWELELLVATIELLELLSQEPYISFNLLFHLSPAGTSHAKGEMKQRTGMACGFSSISGERETLATPAYGSITCPQIRAIHTGVGGW